MDSQKVIVYTDGASRGNPGPGGYGVILSWKGKRKELSAGYKKSTNNRMELMAVITALEALKKEGLEVLIYTDSKYIVNAVEKRWLFGWVKKDFKNKKNKDLWLRFLKAYNKQKVKFHWVKGHAQNPWNNKCDKLATEAADKNATLVDEGFGKN